MFCPRCGTLNDEKSVRCTKCAKVIHAVPPVGRSGLAIAASYAGIFAFLVFPAPIALLLGILAVCDLLRHPHKHGMGRAVFGTIAGALCTALLCWLLYLGIWR
jgi:hypothetical protein